MKITNRDERTIISALEDAISDRQEFRRCWEGDGNKSIIKPTTALIRRYRQLHEKILKEITKRKARVP